MKYLVDGLGTVTLLTCLAVGLMTIGYFAWRGHQAWLEDERRRLKQSAARAEREQQEWEEAHGLTL